MIIHQKRPLVTVFSLFSIVVTLAGVEPAIFWMRTRRPGPLDDRAIIYILSFLFYFFNPTTSELPQNSDMALLIYQKFVYQSLLNIAVPDNILNCTQTNEASLLAR